MSSLIYREVTEEDLFKCAHIITTSFNAISGDYGFEQNVDVAPLITRLKEHIDQKSKLYAAYEGDVQIGFFVLDAKGEDVYEVGKLCVLPEYQEKGYGQQLLDKAVQTALSLDGVGLVCAIIDDNLRLKKWLLRNGFFEQVSGIVSGLPCSVCLMQKDLSGR